MINKDKISRVLIYDQKGRLLVTTKSVSFPKDFFKIKGQDLVMLKGSGFPLISKGEYIDTVFEYINGTRMKYTTSIDLSTEYQINFHVGEGIALEERRHSFKINVSFNAIIPFYIRNEEMVTFDEPVTVGVVNLNLGGVYFRSDFDFEEGDQVMLSFMEGEMELLTDILRAQKKPDSDIVDGYGCRFLNITQAQEERLARYVFECQLAEREKLKERNSKMF
ncbi:MAG: PilZ domain-containing protein [Oscillospiraceae bacterium]|nr:PilZ domain-containing protein [Oscillospiraceae bacterium]